MATVVGKIQDAGVSTKDRSMRILDSQIPPSRRDELTQNIKAWANTNPKLAAFVLSHLLLSAPPTLLFLAFASTTLVSSLLITLLTALTLALSFTAFCTGLAFLLLLPTLLVTTLCATFLFLGGLISYLIVQRFNNDPRTEPIRVKSKETILATKDRMNEVVDKQLKNNDGASDSTVIQPASPPYINHTASQAQPQTSPTGNKSLPQPPINLSKQSSHSPPASKSTPKVVSPSASEYYARTSAPATEHNAAGGGSSSTPSRTAAEYLYNRDGASTSSSASGLSGGHGSVSEHRRGVSQGTQGAGAAGSGSQLNSRFSPLHRGSHGNVSATAEAVPGVGVGQAKGESFSGRMAGVGES